MHPQDNVILQNTKPYVERDHLTDEHVQAVLYFWELLVVFILVHLTQLVDFQTTEWADACPRCAAVHLKEHHADDRRRSMKHARRRSCLQECTIKAQHSIWYHASAVFFCPHPRRVTTMLPTRSEGGTAKLQYDQTRVNMSKADQVLLHLVVLYCQETNASPSSQGPEGGGKGSKGGKGECRDRQTPRTGSVSTLQVSSALHQLHSCQYFCNSFTMFARCWLCNTLPTGNGTRIWLATTNAKSPLHTIVMSMESRSLHPQLLCMQFYP